MNALIGRAWRSWRELMSLIGLRGLMLARPAIRYESVAIVPNPLCSSFAQFDRLVVGALGIVQRDDPRRWARLCREIRIVFQCPGAWVAKYNRLGRVCCVDDTHLNDFSSLELRRKALAVVLVHEATHGFLHSRSVFLTRQNAARIESICLQEELRFVRHFGAEEAHWRQLLQSSSHLR